MQILHWIKFFSNDQVISSLRRALQPAVTDLSIKFDVPSCFKVYQAPEEVPTLFSGDKVVVYGIMKKRKSASDQPFKASVNGTATLTGHILSKPIQFKLTFEISDFQSSVEMPIVHRLSSKALIHELQSRDDWTGAATYEQRKKDIVKLSIETGVVSAHTAYIALDEEQEKLMEGAVKTWDVVATMAQHRKNMPPHIPPRTHQFRRTEGSMFSPTSPYKLVFFPECEPKCNGVDMRKCNGVHMPIYNGIDMSECVGVETKCEEAGSMFPTTSILECEGVESMACPTTLSKLRPRNRRVFTRDSDFVSAQSVYSKCDGMCLTQESICNQSKDKGLSSDRERNSNDTTMSAHRLKSIMKLTTYSKQPGTDTHMEQLCCGGCHLEQDVELPYLRLKQSAQPRLSPRDKKVEDPTVLHNVMPKSVERKTKQRTAKQIAWPRDNLEFLILLQKFEGFWDLDVLQWFDFPMLLKMDNIQICATVYALAYMEIKFPSQRDEWELVARKAEAWLERQTLPDQVNLEELKKEASDYIINNLVE